MSRSHFYLLGSCGFFLFVLFLAFEITSAASLRMGVIIKPSNNNPLSYNLKQSESSAGETSSQPSDTLGPLKLIFDILNVRQLSTIDVVAHTLAVDPILAQQKIPEIEPIIKKTLLTQTGFSLFGSIERSFIQTMTVVSVKNQELSTPRGMEGFLNDTVRVFGSKPFKEAQIDVVKAEILTRTVASVALGRPLDRRTFDKEYKQLGITLLEREKEVVKSGDFQKFFNRKPSSSTDWNLIKIIAYRGRVIDRSISREIAARDRYEKVFNINLKELSESKKQEDIDKTAKAWSFIRAVAANNLTIGK